MLNEFESRCNGSAFDWTMAFLRLLALRSS